MARIYLIGFMGVGKSTVSRKLASMLGYERIDLDDAFEERFKINIAGFFEKYDENLFRQLESELLDSTFEKENVVISTGGGTACYHFGIEKMNKNGTTIYLHMPPESILQRLRSAKRPRPLIKDKDDETLRQFIFDKLEERKPFYEKARLKVDAGSINLEQLVKMIQKEI